MPIGSTPDTRATPIVLLPSRRGWRSVAEATGPQSGVPSDEPHRGLTTCCLELTVAEYSDPAAGQGDSGTAGQRR
jgi:hypothetical protein